MSEGVLDRVGLALVTPPAVEPVSLTEALAHLRVDTGEDGTLILTLLQAARERVEKTTARALIEQQWRLTRDGFPSCGDAIRLRYPPLISVDQVQYVDSNGATQTLASSEYIVDTGSYWGEIALAYGKTWPATRPQRNAVTVTFTVGYGDAAEDVPSPLRAAMLLIIGDLYANREASITGTIVSENPAVRALVDPYVLSMVA